MKSFSYHPKVKRLKSLNLTPIKSMFVVFADTWQSHVHAYCIKPALKEMLLKRTITQINF